MQRRVPLWRRAREERWKPSRILRELGITAPPIDAEEIATALGVRVGYRGWAPWAGKLSVERDRPVILVTQLGQTEARQRFTIAHELGHLLRDEPLDEAFRGHDAQRNSDREVRANRFAAALLMPLWMLDYAVPAMKGDLGKLAAAFGVSEQAMAFRLEKWGR